MGTTLFCLKPYPSAVTQSDGSRVGWKVIYATPSVIDMLGYKVDAVEGHDFMDIVFRVSPLIINPMGANPQPPIKTSSETGFQA